MQNATNFLIQAILSLALYIVLLRFWMQWVRADFRNELGQFVITLTNPVVIPLRKLLPSIRTIDSATLALALIVALIKLLVFFALTSYSTQPAMLLLMSIGLVLKYCIHLFFASIIIGIIASWINPHSYHPVLAVANSIGQPLLDPARRLIPPIAGLDFSPVIVLLLLQFTLHLIRAYLLPLPL
ncbi:YggT family protein [Arenicella xantha]|uniref:YggT family protein n=1 Tax=Arenicella xantha TaxID=644221 RepID=A0A395JKP3_9GAMM|nr:YggT family protein [Arenicella xantha]RBP49761.1 YggT family protein [Arenicella xantha]